MPSYAYKFSFYNTEESEGSITESLTFYDEFFSWHNFSQSASFQFIDENYVLPTIDEPDYITYSFMYYGKNSNVKRYDDEDFSMRFFLYSDFEFVKYEGDVPEVEYTFYIDSDYGRINLIDETLFELNGEYYEIVKNATYWAYNYCGLNKIS